MRTTLSFSVYANVESSDSGNLLSDLKLASTAFTLALAVGSQAPLKSWVSGSPLSVATNPYMCEMDNKAIDRPFLAITSQSVRGSQASHLEPSNCASTVFLLNTRQWHRLGSAVSTNDKIFCIYSNLDRDRS